MTRLLLAVAAIGALLTGCGGVDRDPNLAQAVERTEATGSSSFALDVRETDGTGDPRVFHCEGAADYAAKRMQLECGKEGTYVAVGDVVYASGWSAALLGVPPGTWVRFSIADGDSPHDFAPGTLLAKLRAASIETERLSEEEVRGEETVRYRMTVKCSEADLECSGDTTDVEVWIDGDGLVRRATLQDGTADVAAEFFDFGRDVHVKAPPEGQVSDLDNPSLGRCPGGGSRVSDAELRGALTKQGFEVAGDDSEQCFLGVVATVVGILESGSGSADAGAVICFVYRTADLGAPSSVEESSSSGVVGLRIQNVGCSTFDRIDGPTGARLRAALEDLE